MVRMIAVLLTCAFGVLSCGQDDADLAEPDDVGGEQEQPLDTDEDPDDDPPVVANLSERHSEWIEIPQGGRIVAAFVSHPEVVDPTLALILIHENRGLTDWVRDLADQVADIGYIAIAPDLLSGMAPGGGNTADFANQDTAGQAISALPPAQITADLTAIADAVAALIESNGAVAVAGFCWGGTETFRFATNFADLSAVCVFYGSGPTNVAAIQRITAPVYGFYGGIDGRINVTIPQTEQLMQASGKLYEPIIYDGAGHAFMRRAAETENEADPNKQAGNASWDRLQTILDAHRL